MSAIDLTTVPLEVTAELDATGMVRFVNDLAQRSGKSFEFVLEDRVAKILSMCIRDRRMKAARAQGIKNRVAYSNTHFVAPDKRIVTVWKKANHAEMFLDNSTWRQPGPNEKNPTPAPKMVIGGKTWHQMDDPKRRWSDRRWAEYVALRAFADSRKQDPRRAARSRGVAKQSWLQIAKALGIPVPGVPGYVENATPQNGKTYQNGTAKRVLTAASYFIQITNNNYLAIKRLSGVKVLQEAVSRQMKAFEYDVKNNVFEDLVQRARRYPNLFTAPPTPPTS